MKTVLFLVLALVISVVIFFILAKAIETKPLEMPKENKEITLGSNPLDDFQRYCDLNKKGIEALIAGSKFCDTTSDCDVENFGSYSCGIAINKSRVSEIQFKLNERNESDCLTTAYRCTNQSYFAECVDKQCKLVNFDVNVGLNKHQQ